MGSFAQDLRHTMRVLRRARWFYAGTILTLALGIGANGAVFSILQAVLLQPLPYSHPNDVVMVWRAPMHPAPAGPNILAPPNWRGALTQDMVIPWRDESRDVLSDMAALMTWQGNLEAQFDLALSDRAERLRGALVTPNFFDILGVQAALGRTFTASDETAGGPIIVLSDALWHRAFGGDRSIIGRSISLVSGRPRAPRTFTVIGVLPQAFRFTYPQETEAWVMYSWTEVARYGRGALGFRSVSRLKAGVTFETAQARMALIRTALERPNRPANEQQIVRLEPITDWVIGETRPSMLLLAGVAMLLLLITCATVANALFVRVTERQRELAVRASLGADQRRLVRQLLTEGVVLSMMGAAIGTLFAILVGPLLRALVPPMVPRANEIGMSWWILAFAAAAAGLTTVLAALTPAWRGARFDLVSTLKRASGAASVDRSTARWRLGLVGFQTAVATALLISAVLLLTSFWRLGHVPLGFDGERVLTVEMRLLDAKYQSQGPPQGPRTPSPALATFQENLVSRVVALPGVLQAGLTTAVPFRGVDFVYVLNRVGEKKSVGANARFVDPAYFSVMKISLRRGRVFSGADTASSANVVVISESYARKMFGTEDPIGKAIDYDKPVEVIGVVADVRYQSFEKDPYPAIYFPRSQWPNELICLVARTAPNAGDLGPAIRQIIRELDPALPAMNLTTIDQILNESVADRRFYATATAAFATVALLLTVIGLAVIVAGAVVERRRELAIRAALGATSRRLVRLVVTQGLTPVLVGTVLGLVGAYSGATFLQQFLFQVEPRAPLAYIGVAGLIIVVAAIASLMPARRAAQSAPASLLRTE